MCFESTTQPLAKIKIEVWFFSFFSTTSVFLNIARIANAVQCHSWLSGNKDCHQFRFSIVRIVISVSIVTSLQDCFNRCLRCLGCLKCHFHCHCHCYCHCHCHCHCHCQVSRVAFCMSKVKVREWVSEWVSEWQGHPLSCSGQAKTRKIFLSKIISLSFLNAEDSRSQVNFVGHLWTLWQKKLHTVEVKSSKETHSAGSPFIEKIF